MAKDVYSATEVAGICRVSRQTVNRWLRQGFISAFRPTKTADWKITRKELMRFMRENNIPLEFLGDDRIRVLIVDDEVNITRVIEQTFKTSDRFLVESAHSGFIAGAKLESFKPDVVILDIFLGDMDGREFFKHIRGHPELNRVKVIGISGKLSQDEIESLLDQGFDRFLLKPFTMKMLEDKIIEVAESKR